MNEMKSRHRARELALQGVYQWLLSGNAVDQIEAHIQAETSDFDRADNALFTTLLHGTLSKVDELQEEFAPFIHRTVTELSPIERAVLIMATYEFKYVIETPYKVVINEAIELTKKYGGTDGHRFVNGALDKLAARLRLVELKTKN